MELDNLIKELKNLKEKDNKEFLLKFNALKIDKPEIYDKIKFEFKDKKNIFYNEEPLNLSFTEELDVQKKNNNFIILIIGAIIVIIVTIIIFFVLF